MAGDYARSVQILVEIAGNPEAKLDEINKKLSNLEGKKTNIGIGDQPVNQVNKLSEGITRTNNNFGTLGNTVQNLGSRVSTAFSGFKSSLNELNTGVQTLATSLAGMAAGTAVSGVIWKQSAEYHLVGKQIKEAIENNKKLNITYEELDAFVKQQAEMGEGTKQDTVKEMYAVLAAGSKYFKGSGQDKLNQADAIGDFYFKHQEMMREEGVGSAEQLVQRITMQQGKMAGRFGIRLATAMGLDPDSKEFKSAKNRMKYLMEAGANVDMKAEMEARPWERLEVNLSKLKYSIGDSIATPMIHITNLAAILAETVAKIPGLPGLIGMGGALLAAASATSILIGVLTPLWSFMKAINVALGISTALRTVNTAATTSEAVSHAMLTGAMGTEFAAEELSNVSKNISIGTRLRLIGVMAAERISSLATTAANWLGIPALLGLAGANTAAAGAATGLAVAEGLALSPLLAIAAAGLVLVGVFGLILQKAGILEPLLKGISKINLGKVFKELGAGDLFGAWHQITKGFELPSMKDAFANLMGPSMTTTLTKVFGITMNRMLEWLNSINDELRRIRALWDYIMGLLYKYIYEPLNNIWNWIKEKFGGGEGLTTDASIEKALRERILSESDKKVKDPTYSTPFAGSITPEAIDYLVRIAVYGEKLYKNRDTGETKYAKENPGTGWSETLGPIGATGHAVAEAKKIVEELKNPPVNTVSAAADDSITDPIDRLFGTTKKVFVDNNGQKWNLNIDSDGGYKFRKVNDWGFDSDTPNSGVPAEVLEAAANDIKGKNPILTNALGGIVTKSGLAWIDIDEPIVPAEINRNSHLINVLEAIAGSSSNGGYYEMPVPINDLGGDFTKSGLAWNDINEAIVPAEINRNSHLINVLEAIAGSSPSSFSNNTHGDIIINIDYKVSGSGSGNGMYLDKFAFERAVTEIIGKVTRHYGAY